MFGHQIRMLGRPFSRSVATGLPGIDFSADSRRHSLRVSEEDFLNNKNVKKQAIN